jgi:hypothetical protein
MTKYVFVTTALFVITRKNVSDIIPLQEAFVFVTFVIFIDVIIYDVREVGRAFHHEPRRRIRDVDRRINVEVHADNNVRK